MRVRIFLSWVLRIYNLTDFIFMEKISSQINSPICTSVVVREYSSDLVSVHGYQSGSVSNCVYQSTSCWCLQPLILPTEVTKTPLRKTTRKDWVFTQNKVKYRTAILNSKTWLLSYSHRTKLNRKDTSRICTDLVTV